MPGYHGVQWGPHDQMGSLMEWNHTGDWDEKFVTLLLVLWLTKGHYRTVCESPSSSICWAWVLLQICLPSQRWSMSHSIWHWQWCMLWIQCHPIKPFFILNHRSMWCPNWRSVRICQCPSHIRLPSEDLFQQSSRDGAETGQGCVEGRGVINDSVSIDHLFWPRLTACIYWVSKSWFRSRQAYKEVEAYFKEASGTAPPPTEAMHTPLTRLYQWGGFS